MQIKAFKLLTKSPSDISGLVDLFDQKKILPEEVLCIIGKTEGNGGRNDFTRDLSMAVFEDLFSKRLSISPKEVTDKIIFSLSGGTEGVVSPHITVFAKCESEPKTGDPNSKRLAIGTGFTREFKPEEIGRMEQVRETSQVIAQVVKDLSITDPQDIHFVQMKGAIPNFTYEQGVAAAKAGKPMRSDMVYSRGASALGAACALNEVNIDQLSDDDICSDWSKYSRTASCSAKPGLKRTEIMVMGNSSDWGGDLTINGGTVNDMIDANSIREVMSGLGPEMQVTGQATKEQTEKLIGIFGKSEADPRGNIRGQRHTMLTDDDISDTRYSRCVLSSVIASVVGDTAIYVSTRSEHHGPLGGGTVAMIARSCQT